MSCVRWASTPKGEDHRCPTSPQARGPWEVTLLGHQWKRDHHLQGEVSSGHQELVMQEHELSQQQALAGRDAEGTVWARTLYFLWPCHHITATTECTHGTSQKGPKRPTAPQDGRSI